MSKQYRVKNLFAKRSKAARIDRIKNSFRQYRRQHDDNLSVSNFDTEVFRIEDSEDGLSPVTDEETKSCDKQSSQIEHILTGRRIVELGHISKQLYCLECDHPIHLDNVVHETRHGFGSILVVECPSCGSCRSVTTGKTHRTGKRGPGVFDINTKAALGMIHSGSGHTQIENFMSTLEIQGLHHTTMKKRELEVEFHIQNVCKKSCMDALEEEIQLQRRVSPGECDVINHVLESDCEVTTPVLGQFKYDMGWQKRGAGRSYDSKSGVGTMIGNMSGKVCGFGVRSKDCRKCSYHLNKGQTPPHHKCSKNWDGSSKAMESDVAAQVVMEIEQNENVQVGILIMDDDTTTASKLRETLNHPFVKWSDLNHTRKHLGNCLYNLQKEHKCLTTKTIQYIQKCFSYAVAQNKNNPEGLAKALNQIVPHAFGEHENCDFHWCGYHADPKNYRHSSLPFGEELRGDLGSIFKTLILNVDKIAPGASTKDVESINNMIAAKAPKRCHYSSTSSLQNRVNCVVAEKNIGSTYITKVNESIGMSPGSFYSKHAVRKDTKRKRRLEFENTPSFKKQKLHNKMNRSKQNARKELREGVTYQPSIDLKGKNDKDTAEIPKQSLSPKLDEIEIDDHCCLVYCDIETTGLHKTCDITQLAAVEGDMSFNQYINYSRSHTSYRISCYKWCTLPERNSGKCSFSIPSN